MARVPFPTKVTGTLVGTKPERKYTRNDGSEGLAGAKVQFLVADDDGSANVLEVPAAQIQEVAGSQGLDDLAPSQAYELEGVVYLGGFGESSFFKLTSIAA